MKNIFNKHSVDEYEEALKASAKALLAPIRFEFISTEKVLIDRLNYLYGVLKDYDRFVNPPKRSYIREEIMDILERLHNENDIGLFEEREKENELEGLEECPEEPGVWKSKDVGD